MEGALPVPAPETIPVPRVAALAAVDGSILVEAKAISMPAPAAVVPDVRDVRPAEAVVKDNNGSSSCWS